MSLPPRIPPHVAPTVMASEYFYPRQDAEMLRRAMKGLGTDERAIIDVLSERTAEQRQQIALEFQKTYQRELVKDLRSELSGDLRELTVSSVQPLPRLLARDLHMALRAADLDTLAEILCTHCNSWLHDITAEYLQQQETSLERALREANPGGLGPLLAALSRGGRCEESMAPGAEGEHTVYADTTAIINEEGRSDSAGSRLFTVLTARSLPHLRRVLLEHETVTGRPFEDTLRREFTGPAEKGILAIVGALRDRYVFLARRFYSTMAGIGTDERTLNRLVLSRAELDLELVKEAFVTKYKKSLAAFVEGDTSGDYKRMLLALIR